MGIPMTADPRRLRMPGTRAKDEAAGNQCKYYGAAAIMTLPERLHIYLAGRQHAADGYRRRNADARSFTSEIGRAPDGKLSGRGIRVAAPGHRGRSPSSTPPPELAVSEGDHEITCWPATCARTAFRTAIRPS